MYASSEDEHIYHCLVLLQTGERRLEAAVEVTALEAVLQETPVVVCPLNTGRALGDQVAVIGPNY